MQATTYLEPVDHGGGALVYWPKCGTNQHFMLWTFMS